MKLVLALILLIGGSYVVVNYGSSVIMGGIESGFPGGSHQRDSASQLAGPSSSGAFQQENGGISAPKVTPGHVTENPYF